MENRIKMNVEEERILRLNMPTKNGMVVINNPSQKFKKELINLLVSLLTENKEINEKEIMLDLINHCTNVEFEGDLFESTNLSHEAQMITNEVLIIFQEIISEAYQLIQLAMQQAKNDVLQNEILKEKNKIIEISEKINSEKQNEDVEEIKVTSQRVVKKPSRGRGRVNRK